MERQKPAELLCQAAAFIAKATELEEVEGNSFAWAG